jgi:long-chain acyl-CoA synthetase
MTLDFFDQLKHNAELTPNRIALQLLDDKGQESFTFHRLHNEISKLSQFLARHIHPGETLGILMQNHPRWGIAFLAAESAGARILPLDILHTPKTLAALIRHSDCSFLVSSHQLFEKLDEIQAHLPSPIPTLVMDSQKPDCHDWESVLAKETYIPNLPLFRRDPEDTLLLVYTSGTTGNPKGVMLSHNAIYLTVKAVLDIIQLDNEDHILSVLPLYHMLALMANFLMPLYMATRITYLNAIEPRKILESFRDQGVTVFVCVPQFYYLLHRRIFQIAKKKGLLGHATFQVLLKLSRFSNDWIGFNPGRLLFRSVHRNFNNLRLFAVGGARFDKEVLKSFRDLGFQFAQAFGMTETSAVSTISVSNGLGSAGRPMPHVDLKIDRPGIDGIGEILISGPHIMQAYWKNEVATKNVLKKGWLHSGDLGYLDPNGYLYITGRKKDVIVLSSGKNIFPEEIEHAYESKCPYIREMCVIGVEDGNQEKLHAMIVPDFKYLKSQQVINISDMLRYQIENLSVEFPGYKRIRTFDVLSESLPRTPTRKIKRFEVMNLFKDQHNSRAEPIHPSSKPQDDLERKVFELLKETGKVTSIRHEMSLELDCGFDSLERVEFLSNAQDTFGLNIKEEDATNIFTVQDMIDVLRTTLDSRVKTSPQNRTKTWSDILSQPLTGEEKKAGRQILRRRPIVEGLYFGMSRLLLLLAKALFNLRFDGQDKLPKNGPFLICPNHLSYLDGFLLSAGLAFPHLKRMVYLGYSDYFRTGTLGGYLGSLLKIVPVNPDRYLRQALRLGAYGLSKGYILGIFPEGERSIDGETKPFRKGPAILAKELNVAVIPTAIIGTYEVWPRGSSKIKAHSVTIRFGDPLTPFEHETPAQFTQRMQDSVRNLLEEGNGS